MDTPENSNERASRAENSMTELVTCPVDTCSFEASIEDVAVHVDESTDEKHLWQALRYKDSTEFQRDSHLEAGEQLQQRGREARDFGEYETAVDELEGSLWHFQQAELFTDETSFDERRCEVLETITDVETEARTRVLDDLVDQAENVIDSGNELHLESNPESAAWKYEEATETLIAARDLARERMPGRVPEIERRLRRTRVREQSLERSESHRSIQDRVTTAREHTAAGDQAFQRSKYETALEEYERSKRCYESLVEILQAFSFDVPTPDPEECDVCRERFDEELEEWTIEVGQPLQVCPACAQFGRDGTLPNQREIAVEHRAVRENIESIRDGNVGLDWASSEVSETENSDDRSGRDTRQMLIQLTGVVQTLGHVPTGGDLDERTDFGDLEYRDEFGSIEEALREAGFDV